MGKRTWCLGALGILLGLGAPAFAQEHQVTKSPMLQNKLQDQLGDNWQVAVQGNELIATRKMPSTPADNMRSELNDQVKDVHKNMKTLTVKINNDEAVLGGSIKSCDDLLNKANDFAKIQGVNKITLDARCGGK